MTDDIRPLAIWSETVLTDEDLQRIREAKQSLGLPFLVQFGKAVPGVPSWRVLAIGSKPNFITEYAEVPNTQSAGLAEAIAWVLGEHEDSRAVNLVESMSAIFGEVREVVEDADVEQQLGASGAQRDRDAGPRGADDPNRYDEGNYRRAIRETARG